MLSANKLGYIRGYANKDPLKNPYPTTGGTNERTEMPLNNKLIQSLKSRDKSYKKYDTGGLFIEIRPSGAKIWRMKHQIDGKEQTATFGAYPNVTLIQAREMRDKLKADKRSGVYTPPTQAKAELARRVTFEQLAEKWYSIKESSIADKTKRNIRNRLERHLYPIIGGMDIQTIKRGDLINLADELNEKGILAEAQKIIQTAGQVFEFAILNGLIEHNPTNGVNSILKKPQTEHRAALPQSEVTAFFTAYLQAGGEPVTRIAILLIMLLGTRNKATRLSKWENIDFDNKTWLMPKETMKQGNEFLIPLADWSIELLKELKAITGHTPYLFPKSQKGGGHNPTISESTLNRFVHDNIGFNGKQHPNITIHGFRSLMIDVCAENGFSRQVLKKALAHEESDKSFAPYMRTELLEERRKLAEFYADWLYKHFQAAKRAIAQHQLEQAQAILNQE